MPRRKKLPAVPDYTKISGDPETHVVQKANPLALLAETSMTLAEFKILDAYLAQINSHDPDKRYVMLEKGKIEEYLGVTKISQRDLEKRLNNLFQTITIRDGRKKKGFTLIALFEKAEATRDDDGLWQVELACSAPAMEYFFSVEKIGYFRYRLRNVINLTSRYSYFLFLHLEKNRRMHLSWEQPLGELKEILGCTAERYTQFKFFNSEILKKSCEEINKKTECHFTYEPVKKGRRVTAIRFTLEPISAQISDQPDNEVPDPEGKGDMPGQLTLDDVIGDFHTQHLSFLSGACNNEFSQEEMNVVWNIINTMQLPPHEQGNDFAQYHYLARKYAQLNLAAKRSNIKNRFKYFQKMIEKDAESM